MAKTNVPKFEDTEPIFEDTMPMEDESVDTEGPSISGMEAFGKGVQQGGTLGAGDEFQGAVEGGMDAVQGLLSKLGIMDKSPSQVNAQLAAEGVNGDLGPKSTLDMYRQARDAGRKENEAAYEAHPAAFIGGGITGGLLTTPLMPAKMLAPFGKAAQGAGVATKALQAAKNAAPVALIGGFGLAGGDIAQTPGTVALETGLNTGVGMLGAGLITGGIESGKLAIDPVVRGAKKLGAKMVPDTLKTAWKRGKAGVDTTGDEFYNDVHQRVDEVVKDVSDPIIAKSEAQNQAYHSNIADLDSQIGALKNQQQKALELGKQRQLAQNAADVDAVNKQVVETAKKTQAYMGDVKKGLGKAFDEIDNAAEASGVAPENRDVIGNFMQTIEEQAGIPETEIATILKKLEPLHGQKDIQSFRNLKGVLTRYFEHANPVVRRSAKQAYSALKNNYSSELQANGFDELAAKMAETNKRWSALSELQETFVDNINKNRITNEIQASPDTINAITNFGEKNPKQMAQTEFMTNLMKAADPQGSKPVLNQIATAAEDTLAAKAAPKDIPELPNPQLARLQGLLDQAKAINPSTGKVANPSRVEGVRLSTSPDAMKKELTNLLPKFGMKSGDDVAESTLESTLGFLEKEKGADFVKGLKTKLGPLNEDVALRNVQSGGSEAGLPVGKLDLMRKAIVGPSTKAANMLARGSKKVGEVADKVGDFANKPRFEKKTDTKEFLSQGVKHLSDASPEGLQEVSTRLAQTGETGSRYAKVLEESAAKNKTTKNAIMFGLMQQPEFRELMNKILNNDETDVKP